jgi:bacterioferritin
MIEPGDGSPFHAPQPIRRKNMSNNDELIQGLNHALNREVSTFLRYMLQGASIRGAKWDGVRKMYLEEVQDEVGHAQYLAEKIVMLGGTPSLAPDLTAPPADPVEMLKNDAAQEEVDVQGYLKLAALAEKAGLPHLKIKMEEQAADEAEHAEEMKRLLG